MCSLDHVVIVTLKPVQRFIKTQWKQAYWLFHSCSISTKQLPQDSVWIHTVALTWKWLTVVKTWSTMFLSHIAHAHLFTQAAIPSNRYNYRPYKPYLGLVGSILFHSVILVSISFLLLLSLCLDQSLPHFLSPTPLPFATGPTGTTGFCSQKISSQGWLTCIS